MRLNRFSRAALALACGIVVSSATAGGAEDPESKWEDLISGETLEGWTQYGGEARYRAEDGMIIGTSAPNTGNSFLATKREFGDFILEYEFKVDPNLNSGVQIRSHARTPDRAGRVYGYQVEIDPSSRAWTAGIYDEARRGWLYPLKENEKAREAFKPDDWNRVRVSAIGDSIRTWLNDVPAADLVDSMTLKGFIALQVHGTKKKEPMEVRWRNIRIQDLGGHVWKPLFNGKDLDGWHALPGGEWKVQDGAIVGVSSASENRHGLLLTDHVFTNFTARVNFRVLEGNSGFYFRAEEVDHPVGVFGFQAEIEPGLETGGLYETGGRAWVTRPSPEDVAEWYHRGDWNWLTVSAHGGRIVAHLNDRQTARLEDDPGRKRGRLGLQLHGGQEMHVEFKAVELLTPDPR